MAVADLAAQNPAMPVALSDIAARQSISLSFLEQLFGKLRRAGLVDSQRGAAGGYRLVKNPSDISLAEIIFAVDEDIKAHGCTPEEREGCTGLTTKCLTHNLWGALEAHIGQFLAGITIADVLEENFQPELEAAE